MIGSFLRKAQLTTANAVPLVPSWSLDFSSGEPWANGKNYTFSSTASTTRTFVNSSGYVAPCVANLLLQSEDFSAADWTNANTAVTVNSIAAPDNTTTADSITEDTSNTQHIIYQTIASQTAGTFTTSYYLKKGSRRYVAVWLVVGTPSYGVMFDFDTNTVTATKSNDTPLDVANSITDVGNGWVRVTVTAGTSQGSTFIVASVVTGSDVSDFSGLLTFNRYPSYTGGGSSTIVAYAWGAQLVTGSDALPYSATTTSSNGIPRLTHNSSGSRLGLLVEGQRANILQRSTDFSTSWLGGNTNVPADSVTAPDNLANTTSKIAANTTNAAHWRRLSASSPVTGTTYVYSVFFKAGGGAATHAVLHIETTGTNDRYYNVKYDTATGARTDEDSANSPVNTGSPAQAESYPNGWYRAWVRIEHSTGNSGIRVYAGLSNAATGIAFPTFAGAASNADFIWFWGAQVEASTTTPTSFIPTVASAVTRQADLVHVLDSSITSWGDPGALVVHFYPPLDSGTLISTDDASTAQVGIEASTTTAARAFWSSGSTATGTIGTGVQKAVHYWNGSTSKFAVNGSTPVSNTNNFTIANADFVTLGAEATESGGVPGTFSQYANCVIRKVEFYSGTLTDANLQTITT